MPDSTKSAKREIRYRHPVTGQTWSGRGLKPAWLRAAIIAGKTLEDFAVTKPPRSEESMTPIDPAMPEAKTKKPKFHSCFAKVNKSLMEKGYTMAIRDIVQWEEGAPRAEVGQVPLLQLEKIASGKTKRTSVYGRFCMFCGERVLP